uniref:Uncharacterized protein n=1 Tax=Cryptomonas curvata TaxID=233186 RepID=A0A7S0QMX2_9CRYP|mmetsp:Transcript_37478/g.78487  ORF Transcript_37478/g.78487 Transcript_37478/m.78487 type:complete len:177 (+) Transcript_37478:103-633(+)
MHSNAILAKAFKEREEKARLDAEFKAKMRKLEKDAEDLQRIQALNTAKKKRSDQEAPPMISNKRRRMEKLVDWIYRNLKTDDEHNEFNRRATRLMEILSDKGLSLDDQRLRRLFFAPRMLKKNGIDQLAADEAEAALQALAQKIFEDFRRNPASKLEVITEQDSHGAGASAAPDQP